MTAKELRLPMSLHQNMLFISYEKINNYLEKISRINVKVGWKKIKKGYHLRKNQKDNLCIFLVGYSLSQWLSKTRIGKRGEKRGK